MSDISKNWKKIKEMVKTEYDIEDLSYNTWISKLTFLKEEDNTIFIKVPEDQERLISYISKKFKYLFVAVISELYNKDYEIEFTAKEAVKQKKEIINNPPASSNLIKDYIFENFVVGDNNTFAQSASLAAAENPGDIYNPLFIYGGPGLGKTHLMHSIGNFIINNNPDMKVIYVTSEQFTNEVIASIRGGNASSMTSLREKYRTVDVLLIDDIQFIIGKDATQEEFFHTFNELYSEKKQIVITSDKPPKQINNIDDRIRSRFEMGLIADIQAPNYETRIAILQKLAEKYNKKVDNNIFDYIAENITSNVRELEGAYKKVMAYSKLNNMPLNIDVAVKALQDMIYPEKNKIITPELILEVVSSHFGLTKEQIASKKRNRELIIPRHIVMYLCRELTSASYSDIASVLNKKDHTTVINGFDNITNELTRDETLKNNIEIIKKKLLP